MRRSLPSRGDSTLPRALLVLAFFLTVVVGGCDFSGDHEGTRPAPAADAAGGDGAADSQGDAPEDTWAPACQPGESTCLGLRRRVCTGRGDGWAVFDCPPGAGCVDGSCESAHPRVVFVFDTSSSMFAPAAAAGGTYEPPVCASIEAPGSRIAESKALFRLLFAAPLPTAPRMGLFRFPQRATAAPECDAAFWTGLSRLSGDDDSHVVPGGRGSWFRNGLGQALIVPISSDPDEDGRAAIVRWLDGEERVVRANKDCTSDGECSGGFCSGGTCWRELEPELRAGGGTPLGRTMFYAAEYYRVAVLVDGKACSHDGECGSPGYRCGEDGRCHDPLAQCRANHLVVFSDGDETAHPDPDDFYNPLVQARRLRYGLACERDADCLAGASCAPSGTCAPPGAPDADLLEDPERAARIATTLAATDPLGAQHATRLDGEPVSIQVHALDVWGNPENRAIAWLGGGEYVSGSLADPAAVLDAMNFLLESKGTETVCR